MLVYLLAVLLSHLDGHRNDIPYNSILDSAISHHLCSSTGLICLYVRSVDQLLPVYPKYENCTSITASSRPTRISAGLLAIDVRRTSDNPGTELALFMNFNLPYRSNSRDGSYLSYKMKISPVHFPSFSLDPCTDDEAGENGQLLNIVSSTSTMRMPRICCEFLIGCL